MSSWISLRTETSPASWDIPLLCRQGRHVAAVLQLPHSLQHVVERRHGQEIVLGEAFLAEGVEAIARICEVFSRVMRPFEYRKRHGIEGSGLAVTRVVAHAQPSTGVYRPADIRARRQYREQVRRRRTDTDQHIVRPDIRIEELEIPMLRGFACHDVAVQRFQHRPQLFPDLAEQPPVLGIFRHVSRSTHFGFAFGFHPFGDVLIHPSETARAHRRRITDRGRSPRRRAGAGRCRGRCGRAGCGFRGPASGPDRAPRPAAALR